MRTSLFAGLFFAFSSALASAQDKAELAPRRQLHDYLIECCQKHFDERRQTVADLKSPDDLRKRQEALKAKFFESIGPLPTKTPLSAKVVGTLKGDGFRVEKVIYESRPNHHVTANLYLPDAKGPVPAVLVPCGHSGNGKAYDSYQRMSMLLAKNGIAALCYDPIGQGERRQLLTDDNKPGIPSMTSEHTQVGIGGWLVGQGTASFRIWDGMRSIDYLVSRPEIDATRIGCTGNSGGGTMTAYLGALDDRVACAVPGCYITSLEKLFATIGPQDAEQNIVGQVAMGLEHADFLTLRAPKPTMMAVATQDFFNIDGARKTFQEAKRVFELSGHPEKMAFFEYDDKHGLSKPRRVATASWMARWLLGAKEPVVEGKLEVFKTPDLQCTRSGQVLTDFQGVSAFQLNARYADEAKPTRDAFVKLPAEEQRRIVLKALRLGAGDPKADNFMSLPSGTVEFRTQGDLPVVGQVFPLKDGKISSIDDLKQAASKRPLTVVCSHGGLDEFGVSEKVRAASTILQLALRGFGGKGSAGDDNAMLALHLDRPLLGQRVTDLRRVLTELGGKTPTKVRLLGQGAAAPAVLHAAALTPQVEAVELVGGVVSWENVVQTPKSAGQLSNVVPGVLLAYDLPQLAATLAPRPLTLRGVVDATGKPLPLAEVEAAYRVCRDAYDRAGASKNFRIE